MAKTDVGVEPFSTRLRAPSGAALRSMLARQGILLAFILFLIGFSLLSSRFSSWENVSTVFRQVSIVGTMAIGVTFVVISGHLDLSVGSMLSFATVMVVDLHDKIGTFPAIVVMFLAVCVLGSINGLLVGFAKLNSLIVTLGMLSAIQGLTLIYSNGQNVDIRDPTHTWFAFFGRDFVAGLAVPVWIFLLLAIAAHIVLTRTTFGRRVFAVGGNGTAAAFSGIRRGRVVFATYILSALGTGFAALILGSRVMGSQNNVGEGYELTVLASIILGGTSLLGGSGSIPKTIIGVLILGFIQNGLLLLGYPYYTQWIVTWIVIILAVWLDVASKRGRLFTTIS